MEIRLRPQRLPNQLTRADELPSQALAEEGAWGASR
jgi:hypothetical protein